MPCSVLIFRLRPCRRSQVGSSAYMSPERLRGDEYNFTADIWSVGVILLEALLKEHPFPPSKYQGFLALFKAISSGQTPPPPKDTPAELVDALNSCLQVEPTGRPTVDALLAGPWLSRVGSADVKQPVLAWLMKVAGKKMAERIAAM